MLEPLPTAPDAGTAHLPPEMKADPFASPKFMPEPDNMPITDIEEVYKGCMVDRDNVSIAILGGSGKVRVIQLDTSSKLYIEKQV